MNHGFKINGNILEITIPDNIHIDKVIVNRKMFSQRQRVCESCKYHEKEGHEEPCVSCEVGNSNYVPSVGLEERTEERTETHACDCISRQAAIDAMVNELSYLPITTEKAYEIAEVLNDLPSAQPEQQWIPCSERLPAVPVCRCLITRDDGRGRVTVEEALFSFSRWYSNEHLEDGRNRKFDISASVIAWAPFPAPYRGGDSE